MQGRGTSEWRLFVKHLCFTRCGKHNIYDNAKKLYGQPGLCAATQTQLHTRTL